MKNKMTDLRNHLFATLEALQDDEKPMELDRAKAIAEVAQVLINSAKVEVEMRRVVGDMAGTDFIPVEEEVPVPRLVNGGRA